MSIGALPLSSAPIAAEGESVSSSGTGSMAPFSGVGTQGTIEFRGERFWATETRTRWRARESDSQAMLGTTDKVPGEKVWYECDFLDVLHGASLTAVSLPVTGGITVLSHELVSNGAQVHLVRALVDGGSLGETATLSFYVDCSDGARRYRTLKIRMRML